MSDEELLRSFEAATLTAGEWTHREHLRVAYLYLRAYGPQEGLERMRRGIQKLNQAHLVPEGPDRGYHETLTRAWLHLLWATLCEFGPTGNSEAFLEQQTQLCNKRVLLLFYSRDRIMSPEARRRFLEPDLCSLPESARVPRDDSSH